MSSAFFVPLRPATKVTKEETPGAMKNFTTFEIVKCAGGFRSRCQRHRKRESRHRVNGCSALRSQLRHPVWCTTADRMANIGNQINAAIGVAAAEREGAGRFVMCADEKLTAFLELEAAVRQRISLDRQQQLTRKR